LKLLLYGIKEHNTCYLIRTQGGVQPCLMPYPRPYPALPTSTYSKHRKTNKIPRSFREKLNDSAFTNNSISFTMAPNLTALTSNNLRLKVPDWWLWAYTDGTCLTYKSQQRVGAGVFTWDKTDIYVNPGGFGISNTINRAELTGIASALRAKCTHIAMDSAYSYLRFGTALISCITQEAQTCQTLRTNCCVISKGDKFTHSDRFIYFLVVRMLKF